MKTRKVTALLVMMQLGVEPRSAMEIAESLRADLDSVRGHLLRLFRHGQCTRAVAPRGEPVRTKRGGLSPRRRSCWVYTA